MGEQDASRSPYSQICVAIGLVEPKRVVDVYRQIRYLPLLIGLILGGGISIWVKRLNLTPFLALFVSAIAFFGGYIATLIVAREPMTTEFKRQIIRAIRGRMKGKND